MQLHLRDYLQLRVFHAELLSGLQARRHEQERPSWNEGLAQEIISNVRDLFALQVLTMFLKFNHSVLMTNFFREDEPPAALAFRLDPHIVMEGRSKTLYTEVPYGIYLVMGRAFHGFHVRFRKIARGCV